MDVVFVHLGARSRDKAGRIPFQADQRFRIWYIWKNGLYFEVVAWQRDHGWQRKVKGAMNIHRNENIDWQDLFSASFLFRSNGQFCWERFSWQHWHKINVVLAPYSFWTVHLLMNLCLNRAQFTFVESTSSPSKTWSQVRQLGAFECGPRCVFHGEVQVYVQLQGDSLKSRKKPTWFEVCRKLALILSLAKCWPSHGSSSFFKAESALRKNIASSRTSFALKIWRLAHKGYILI